MSHAEDLVQEFRDVIIQATSPNESGEGERLDLGFVQFSSREVHGIPDYQQLFIPKASVSHYTGSLTIGVPPSYDKSLLRDWLIDTPYRRRISTRLEITEESVLAEAIKYARAPHLSTESLRILGLLSSAEEVELARKFEAARIKFDAEETQRLRDERLDEEEEEFMAQRRAGSMPSRPVQYR